MNKRRVCLGFALVTALILLAAPPIARADPPSADVKKIRIEIDDNGFNGNPDDFTVEVEQGQLVEMTFAWAHVGSPSNSHVIVLNGYKLEWDQVDATHKEATVQFIADKPGTFVFKCDLDCEIHDQLQRGHLKVGTGSTAASNIASRAATVLQVSPSAWKTSGELVSLMATLRDKNGQAVPKAEVSFYASAEFAGKKGQLLLGTARTDSNGVAFLEYRPTLPGREQTISVRFDGQGIYSESKQEIQIQLDGPPASAYESESLGLAEIRAWAPIGLVAVLVSIWALYATMLGQVVLIFRGRSKG